MKEHQAAQIAGTAGTVKANIDAKYDIPEAETHLIRVNISKSTFDTDSGVLLKKVEQTRGFDVKDFLRMVEERAFIGKNVKIVHDPRQANQRAVKAAPTPANGIPAATVTAPANTGAEMDVEAMSEGQLRTEYKALFGEDSDILASPAELRIDIKEKRAFNAHEAEVTK